VRWGRFLRQGGVVLDHYDRRDNERTYRKYAKISLLVAAILLILALLSDFLIFHNGTYTRG